FWRRSDSTVGGTFKPRLLSGVLLAMRQNSSVTLLPLPDRVSTMFMRRTRSSVVARVPTIGTVMLPGAFTCETNVAPPDGASGGNGGASGRGGAVTASSTWSKKMTETSGENAVWRNETLYWPGGKLGSGVAVRVKWKLPPPGTGGLNTSWLGLVGMPGWKSGM